MYIRRKVFSLVENQENNYEMEERLYSTGDVELDELLERAFCEGYEFAQMEFSAGEKIDAGIEKVKETYGKGKEKAKGAYDSVKGYISKHLGKEGTLANKVSGWAHKGESKVDQAIAKEIDKYNKKLTAGEISKKAFDKKMKQLGMGEGSKVHQLTKKGLKVIGENPRAAAGIAAGTLATGIGAGVYAANRKKD